MIGTAATAPQSVAPPDDETCRLSATRLVRLLRARELSAVELLDRVLARADEVADSVNPFSVRLDDTARAAAREADRLLSRGEGGPLAGLPGRADRRAPAAGIWRIGPRGKLQFMHAATDWHDLDDDTEAFYLRITGPGDYRYKGADLGILITRGRLQSDDAKTLTSLCKRWVTGIKAQFASTPVDIGSPVPTPPPTASTKSL